MIQAAQGGVRSLGILNGALASESQRAGSRQRVQERLPGNAVITRFVDNGLNSRTHFRMTLQQQDQRQRDLSFRQVRTGWFAENILTTGEIKQVVNELEGGAQLHPIVAHQDLLL